MKRDQARINGHLGPVSNASEVVRLANRHDAGAVGLRPLDAHTHGLFTNDLAVTALTVQGQHRAGIKLHCDAGIGLQTAL